MNKKIMLVSIAIVLGLLFPVTVMAGGKSIAVTEGSNTKLSTLPWSPAPGHPFHGCWGYRFQTLGGINGRLKEKVAFGTVEYSGQKYPFELHLEKSTNIFGAFKSIAAPGDLPLANGNFFIFDNIFFAFWYDSDYDCWGWIKARIK